MNKFQMIENNNLAINSSKAIGCSVVNIGSEDLWAGTPHLVLGLVWQIIKIGLFSKITLLHHPELYRLLDGGEALEDFLKLPPESILQRWFNYHLRAARHPRTVTNFAGDLKDSECYVVLLSELCPAVCSVDLLRVQGGLERAEAFLTCTEQIDCRKYVTPKSIVEGNPRLNVAFLAYLFNSHPGLAPLEEHERQTLDDSLFDSLGDREARAFALWMNSLNVTPFVYNVFTDLRDGRIFAQIMDKIRPGLVAPGHVNQVPRHRSQSDLCALSRFEQLENTNYAVQLGRSLSFSLVGIQGSDLTDGHKTLTLAFVWQLMRAHVISTLRSIADDIKDDDIIRWANATAEQSRGLAALGRAPVLRSFKDAHLSSSLFFAFLMDAIQPGSIDTSYLVASPAADDALKGNAQYVISVARKLGATIFLLPEDVVEVKNKMIMTFIGSLMATSKKIKA